MLILFDSNKQEFSVAYMRERSSSEWEIGQKAVTCNNNKLGLLPAESFNSNNLAPSGQGKMGNTAFTFRLRHKQHSTLTF